MRRRRKPAIWVIRRTKFARTHTRRYTRHTFDLNRLDADIRAATWRCEHIKSSCEASRTLRALGQTLRKLGEFRKNLFDLVGTVETAANMTGMEKERKIDEAYGAVNEYALELNRAIGKARRNPE